IIPNLRQWVPPSLLINGSWEDSYNAQKNTLFLANGSELEIMSYDQELEKFAGVPRHFTHFDEECPQDVYQECLARLVDYNGHWWMTMTPVDGMTWTYDTIYDPSNGGDNRLIHVTNVSMMDNPHLSEEGREALLEGYDDEQRQIRGTGSYVAIGGLVFKYFKQDEHVIDPFVPPANWTFYQSLDHGFNNPTAWLWHAVSPDGTVITFDEHYKSEMTVEQHAHIVKEKEQYYREQYGITPFLRIADPAIKQRSAVTGYSIQIEYSLQGLDLALGQLRSVDAGLNRMNTYHQNGKWYITSNCTNLLKEMRKYKRKTYMSSKMKDRNNRYEEPMKKDDHAIDSARYFFSFMPELKPLNPGEKPAMSKADVARLVGAGTTFNPAQPILIDRGTVSQSETFIIDEFLGGEF
ncbi:MAG TPA: terminase family protein, partial [Chitinophagaceae bacterium]